MLLIKRTPENLMKSKIKISRAVDKNQKYLDLKNVFKNRLKIPFQIGKKNNFSFH